MKESHDVVIVGGGQAGLSLSYALTSSTREHIVLERGAIGQSWRTRWDSFCLVLPSWTIQLAGYPYAGPAPDAFLARDAVVDYLDAYAASFRAPVREGVTVTVLERDEPGGFVLHTSAGQLTAREVVLATGAYQRPYRPAAVQQLPPSVTLLEVADYTNPAALPPGKVLVIGSAQTGCQIAEELVQSGREVCLACGRAPWLPRRIGGRDMFTWLADTPFMNMALADLPSPMARLGGNVQVSGRDGGHDLHYRTLQAMGVTLLGHLLGVEDGRAFFAADLADSVAFGDARYHDLCTLIRQVAQEQRLPVPDLPAPPPFLAAVPEQVDLQGFGAAIVTAGYRPDYTSWVHLPQAFDELGFPLQTDGSSTVVPGLHFMGVHFQRKRKSATLYGVGEDAEILAERLARTPTM